VFVLSYIAVSVAAYLLGSIPTGFLVAKARGVDIRAVGSGNIGAANTFRAIGKTAGFLVLVIDALKGYAAVWISGFILKFFGVPESQMEPYRVVAGAFAVIGHNYTCWLHFKGGKGIATSGGAYLALAPLSVLYSVVAFVVGFGLTRITSVGSIMAAIMLPTAVYFTKDDWTLRIVTITLGLLALLRHRANIQRLIAGTENRVQFKKRAPEQAKSRSTPL
jgi:acyl phosphate:glycerol-3-phosphate acyltransferase